VPACDIAPVSPSGVRSLGGVGPGLLPDLQVGTGAAGGAASDDAGKGYCGMKVGCTSSGDASNQGSLSESLQTG
jgi:hypothetical protein